GLVLALALSVFLTGWTAVPLVLATLTVVLWLSVTALWRIGGQTGDVLGATQQLAEVACLAVLSARA
ncbi:MAG TPA: adenosylcobinamide-GDP ribazoletransferase, partial [Tabrizicola sp.]|nr:adenosylcobinamide-GDP ribazoletransferase [Tabrizicola sp.]